ncbi:alpha/beta hydrolase [Streptomyces sp. NPDC046909]|uniref:alpha/beta hydrolase n=1 Tax=Streptomyces sp. NPDC046909 TaxID=3155617 RepID=UPI0033C44367
MTYALDPELVEWAAALPEFSFTDYAELRAAEEAALSQAPPRQPAVPLDVRDLTVPGPSGAPDVPVRVYAPSGRDGLLPGLLYIHGGGFVMGSVGGFDSEATRISAEVGAVVVSVEYRLAPESPFPAGLEDCYAALTWVAAHADELGIDTGRLGVGGESAGGGLSAAIALLARDRGGPSLCFQYLGIPELDDRLDTSSMLAFHDTPVISRAYVELSWDYYLGEGKRGGPDVSPYAAPARVADLSGLPPAYVAACEFDPLRDEGIAYAQRLQQAGVPTELHLYPGTFHGSTPFVPDATVSRRMVADQLDAIRRGLGAERSR